HHLEPEALETSPLSGIVGKESNFRNPEVDQYLRAEAVVASVRREAEVDVGLDGIHPLVLKVIGLELGHQADATALVMAEVNDRPAPLLGNTLKRHPQLGSAIAALRSQHVSG